MTDDNPSIVHHLSVGAADLDASGAFYDALLAPIGATRVLEEPYGIAWGKGFPEFWAGPAFNGAPVNAGNGVHVAFTAPSREAVDAGYAAGLAAGGTCDGPPGERDYYEGYYAAFMLDPSGNKVELVHLPLD